MKCLRLQVQCAIPATKNKGKIVSLSLFVLWVHGQLGQGIIQCSSEKKEQSFIISVEKPYETLEKTQQ